MKAYAIVSGGMDSAVLAYGMREQFGPDLHLLSFDYGQRHRRELECAAKIAAHLGATHQIIDISGLRPLLKGSSLTDDAIDTPHGHYAADNMKLTVVPNRNAIMLSIAWGIAVANGGGILGAGVHAGDHFIYPDCRPEFVQALDKALCLSTDGFAKPTMQLWTPFLYKTKTDIAAIGGGLQVPFQDTWTCYEGGEVHCGLCGACQERREAFRDSGIFDPTVYAHG